MRDVQSELLQGDGGENVTQNWREEFNEGNRQQEYNSKVTDECLADSENQKEYLNMTSP